MVGCFSIFVGCSVLYSFISLAFTIKKKKKRFSCRFITVLTIDGPFSVFSHLLGALLGPSVLDGILDSCVRYGFKVL